MGDSWKHFLILTGVCLVVQAFFTMMEMACVSFNKVRLQYYVSKNVKRAIWLSKLLKEPAMLFGTTLIGVNIALLVGSESSRHFYISLGLNPDWAPLSQTFIVLIFSEITPMMTGRRYAEHVAMTGIPVLYFFSLVLRPVIIFLNFICTLFGKLFRKNEVKTPFITREELQKFLEEREERGGERRDFDKVITKIFSLKNKVAKELMKPISETLLIPSIYSVDDLRDHLQSEYSSFIPVYHKHFHNIVSVVYPRDLIKAEGDKRAVEYGRPAWFITETNSVIQILKQFRRNNQSVAIVLNEAGHATGVLTLDEVIDEIFEKRDRWMSFSEVVPHIHDVVIDKTFSGDTKLSTINAQFGIHLSYQGATTLNDLVIKVLGHVPTQGEVVRVDRFELYVEDANFLGAKTVNVRSMY